MGSLQTLVRVLILVVSVSATVIAAHQTTSTPLRTVRGGILDEIVIYGNVPAPKTVPVVARPFSATADDLAAGGQKGELKKETKDLQDRGPRLLVTELVTKLKEGEAFTSVTVLDGQSLPPSNALVVEGRFTMIDPGSQAKRYFVGFGAGKSGVAVWGSVKTSDGKLLATFVHKRIGVMGVAGGDSTAKLVSDATSIGEDIAKFLTAWVTGKKLK